MSDNICQIVDNFKVFHSLPQSIKRSIKIFFVSIKYLKFLAYFVTNDDEVYGLGEDIIDSLGYDKSNGNNNYVLISELCNKNIDDFYDGFGFTFARSYHELNNTIEIYSWGWNETGLMGYGFKSQEYFKPTRVLYFDNKNIVQISCELNYCAALSSNGLIYEWGTHLSKKSNQYLIPSVSESIDKSFTAQITYIQCFQMYIYAIAFNGVFRIDLFNENVWLLINCFNNLNQIVLNLKQINATNYEINENNKKYENVTLTYSNEFNIRSVWIDNYDILCESEDNLLVDNKISRFKNLFEYHLFKYQSTHKTIQLQDDQLYITDYVKVGNQLVKTIKPIYKNSEDFYQFLKEFEINSNLNGFRLSNDLPQSLDSDVKCYYQRGCVPADYFACFSLNDNNFHATGHNIDNRFGLKKTNTLSDYTLIPKLCGLNIQEIYCKPDICFIKTDTNEVFCSGRNSDGQLARGYKSDALNPYLETQKIDFFDDKNIVQIEFGFYHILVLSSVGIAYGLGRNETGEIGCGQEYKLISTPFDINSKLEKEERFKYIHCYESSSFAVTVDGKCYYWGGMVFEDNVYTNIEFKPKYLNVDNVSKVCKNNDKSCLMLKSNGNICSFNFKDNRFEKIVFSAEVLDITTIPHYEEGCVLETDDTVWEIYFEPELEIIETNFINFYDYFLYKHNTTYKTIHISKDGYLFAKTVRFIRNNKKTNDILVIKDTNIFDMKFNKYFDQIEQIGEGGFGVVFKVTKKLSGQLYAIKKMISKDLQDKLREIRILSKLKSDFVIQYYDSWMEGMAVNRTIERSLFIQMDLCSQNLRDILNLVHKISDKTLQIFKYYISCEIFSELIDCVNYLHSLPEPDGPIIHRDLKPENVLISDGINGRFLKLCDFGLANVFRNPNQTRMAGTRYYMAPEILYTNKYNLMADIYSLALICTEIFHFGDPPKFIRNMTLETFVDRYLHLYSDSSFENKFRKLFESLKECLYSENYEDRPDSNKLKIRSIEWKIDKRVVFENISIEDITQMTWMYVLKQISQTHEENSVVNQNMNISNNKTNEGRSIRLQSVNQIDSNHRYNNIFEEISKEGSGSFGTVMKVKHKCSGEIFAIKISKQADSSLLKEIAILSKLKSDFVVQYIDSWIEKEMRGKQIVNSVYIQMEFCSQNLRDIIELRDKIFSEKYEILNFSISCQIFKQLTECVNYLHSIPKPNGPVIHRDLKPENILISDEIKETFLKLCDFGLAKVYETSINTRMVGTWNYMAPEVLYSNHYNTKSDIYSLALIATEIFGFKDNVRKIRQKENLNEYLLKYLNTSLEKKFKRLVKTLTNLLSIDYKSRFNCKQLLVEINEINIEKNIILKEECNQFLLEIEKSGNHFLKMIFKKMIQ